jgi:hypothetical protein
MAVVVVVFREALGVVADTSADRVVLALLGREITVERVRLTWHQIVLPVVAAAVRVASARPPLTLTTQGTVAQVFLQALLVLHCFTQVAVEAVLVG